MNCVRQSLYRYGSTCFAQAMKHYCTRTLTGGKNLYNILGIDVNASAKDVKAAYYQLSKKYHPDTNAGGSSHKFHELTEAYETLKNSCKRKDHDREIGAGQGHHHGSYSAPSYEYYGFEPRPGASNAFYDDDGWEKGHFYEDDSSAGTAAGGGSFFHWTYYYDPPPKPRRQKPVDGTKVHKRQFRNEIRKKYKDPNQFEWWPKLFRCIVNDDMYDDDFLDMNFTNEELEIIKIMLHTWVRNEKKRRKKRRHTRIRYKDRVMTQEEYERFVRDIFF